MTKKERERLKVLARLAEGGLTQKIAAKQLNIGVRQIQRLLKKYKYQGDIAIVSKKRGRKSNNRLSEIIRKKAVELIKKHYSDFKPTLAKEKLEEVHDLILPVSTVRNLMIEHKILVPKTWKKTQIHKQRDRRACFGELIQMDGSYHDWFEGRSSKCCLLVTIDDATSRLLWLQFVDWETCFGYFDVLKNYIKKFGIPLAIYTDRHAVFETTRKTEKDYRNTQFHRAMCVLGIDLVLAGTPQAKGRVERVNGILQDRLIKEMRLASISCMKKGNTFLPTYIKQHNQKFAKEPRSSINAHRGLDSEHNLERILCLQHERMISKDLMVSWKGSNYQITELSSKYRLGRKKILIMEQEDESFEIVYQGKSLEFENFDKRSAEAVVKYDPAKLSENWKKPCRNKPGKNHPWRKRI